MSSRSDSLAEQYLFFRSLNSASIMNTQDCLLFFNAALYTCTPNRTVIGQVLMNGRACYYKYAIEKSHRPTHLSAHHNSGEDCTTPKHITSFHEKSKVFPSSLPMSS